MLEHSHSHSCGCNSHIHTNENHHSCGCHSHSDNHTCGKTHKKVEIKNLSQMDIHLLKHILDHKYLPVARFITKSSKSEDFLNIALSPVFINQSKDSLELVKSFGVRLKNLEDLGLISIDYDIPLKGYPYNEYYTSDIYSYFKQTVKEAKENTDFLGDIAEIECGSIAPTKECEEILHKN